MKIVACDLSLTCTGVAYGDGDHLVVDTIVTRTLRGVARLDHIAKKIRRITDEEEPQLVVIEGYAYGRENQAHALGELGGVIRLMLYRRKMPVVVVQPSSMKQYATGKGNAAKNDVLLAAARRLDYAGSSNDEADALWLLEMACDKYRLHPCRVPFAHRKALDKPEWPQTKGDE